MSEERMSDAEFEGRSAYWEGAHGIGELLAEARRARAAEAELLYTKLTDMQALEHTLDEGLHHCCVAIERGFKTVTAALYHTLVQNINMSQAVGDAQTAWDYFGNATAQPESAK